MSWLDKVMHSVWVTGIHSDFFDMCRIALRACRLNRGRYFCVHHWSLLFGLVKTHV